MTVPILHITETDRTPGVDFNAITGVLSISGRSIHRDPIKFYRQLLDWMDRYIEQPCHHTTFTANFDYLNSPSLSCISQVFMKLKSLTEHGHLVTVQWHFTEDDDEMKTLGEEYARLQELPIRFFEVKES